MEKNYEYKKLYPFKWFILENFPFIEADFDAITNWQLFCKLGKEMNKVIDSVNMSGEQVELLTEAFTHLQDYVNNFFDNLDVQDEINNKLDEMAESGQLENIIAQYLSLAGMITFKTVNEMKQAENLIDGSKCQTLGYHSINDGGGATYLVRNITNNDVIDEGSIIRLNNPSLVGELIIDNKVNILNFGYEIESVSYDERTSNVKNITDSLRNAISYLVRRETAKGTSGGTRGLQIYFPDDFYYIDETIDLDGKEISLLGDSPAIKTVDYRTGAFRQKILTNVDGAVFEDGGIHFRGLNFENILTTNTNLTTFSSASIKSMTYCHANNYECVMNNLGGVCTIDTNYFLNCRKYFIHGTTSDSIIINNYINAAPEQPNTIVIDGSMGMTVFANNYVDFFKTGIQNNTSIGVRIVNNTFDYIHSPFIIGGVEGVTISNNSFNHISKNYASMLHYEETSTEALTNWKAIELKYTIKALTITGNTVNNTDCFIDMQNNNASTNITTANNILDEHSSFGNLVFSAASRNSYKIKFYDLNDRISNVSPTIYNTFTNQIIHYEGATYKNIGNKVITVGIDSLNLGIEKNYTASGGGNTTLDMSALPSGGLTACFVLEVRTTKGYNNPSLAKYNVIRIGNNLVIKELFNDSESDFRTSLLSSGLNLTISFSGTYEESSSSKQVFIRSYAE